MKIYLSGPITGHKFDDWQCDGWRQEARRLLEWDENGDTGLRTFSPLRGKVFLKNLKEPIEGEYRSPLTNKHAITHRDRHDCLTCDAMLVCLLGAKSVSIGTMIELGWADAARKPIVMVMEPGNIHEHVIAESIPVVVVDNLAAGCDVIKRILLP